MPNLDGFAVAEAIRKDPSLAGATIMLLISAGQRGDAAHCRELGIGGGGPELLRDLVALFLENYPPRLAALRAAVVRGHAPGIAEAAHGLKGALRNLAAGPALAYPGE